MKEAICSWCLRELSEVCMLIAGRDAHICDECIATCAEIVNDVKAERSQKRMEPPRDARAPLTP